MIQTQDPRHKPQRHGEPPDDSDTLLTLLHETQADLERIIADNIELKNRLLIATELLQKSTVTGQHAIELLGRR